MDERERMRRKDYIAELRRTLGSEGIRYTDPLDNSWRRPVDGPQRRGQPHASRRATCFATDEPLASVPAEPSPPLSWAEWWPLHDAHVQRMIDTAVATATAEQAERMHHVMAGALAYIGKEIDELAACLKKYQEAVEQRAKHADDFVLPSPLRH